MDPLIIAIGLYFLAIALAVIDIFVPSGGFLLILSGIAAIGAIVFGFRAGVNTGLIVSIVVTATIPVLVYSAIKLWPHTAIGRRVMLSPPNAQESATDDRLSEFVGIVVINRWPLAPMGLVKIGFQRFNAMSCDSKVIDAGKRVRVVDVHEGILVVAETSDPITDPSASGGYPQQAIHQATGIDQNLLETPAQQLGLNDLNDLPLDDDRQ